MQFAEYSHCGFRQIVIYFFQMFIGALAMGYGLKKKSYVNGILIAWNVIAFLYLEIAGSSQDVLFMLEKGARFAPAVI